MECAAVAVTAAVCSIYTQVIICMMDSNRSGLGCVRTQVLTEAEKDLAVARRT
jgi:hypothetical protein